MEKLLIEKQAILLIFVSILIAYLLIPRIIKFLILHFKARKDYKLARGTFHLKQINESLKNLSKEIEKKRKIKTSLSRELSDLNKDENKELEKTVTTQIVKEDLSQVKGIGKKLRERILKISFDGTFNSLHNAYCNVEGIGDDKQYNLSSWVDLMEVKLQRSLKDDFPGKKEIIKKYIDRRKSLENDLTKINNSLNYMNKLKEDALQAKKRLNGVKIKDFRKCLKGEEVKEVNEYIKGAFTEWQLIPKWYKDLISNYVK